MSAVDNEDAVEVAEPERRKPRWPLIVAGAAAAVALAPNASAYREISVETVVSEAMAELHVEVGR